MRLEVSSKKLSTDIGSLSSEAVPEKLAIQDLFKELNRLKEDSLKSYSRIPAQDKLTVSSLNLHAMACQELDNWKRLIIRRELFRRTRN